MDDIIAMTKVKRVGYCKHNLCNLGLIRTSMQIFRSVQLPTLTKFHDDVEISGIIIDLVYFDDVGMFELSHVVRTERRISHSFMYMLRSCLLIFFLSDRANYLSMILTAKGELSPIKTAFLT